MSESEHLPLAVVGMSCRYPGGVRSPEDLWQVAVTGREVLSAFPRDRGWDLDALLGHDAGRPGTAYVDRGGFLADVAGFDPGFFGISPREATAMDPQQRLLLEVAWEALERSGLDPASLRGSRTGVFVGGEPREYGPRLYEAPDGFEAHLLTGTTTSLMSGRIAYSLGLRGPALTVDTSASSSLVALHLAAQALRHDECSLALAGGVSVMATPGNFVAFSRLRGLAPDGRCKVFSADADGTVWSEGVGLLVLERLSDAVRNGHRVLAVVRGTAINSDGASDGLTAPNGQAQAAVITQALANAGLTTDDVDAVEAHGTGTPLGDRTEAGALAATYGRGRAAQRPLLIGSLKSNIGHTQAAAGVAGVIKTVMALRHGVLPASLNIGAPNPHIDWPSSGLRLLTEAQPWPEAGRVRRAGVSSFGLSGTNAHAILEQAPHAVASSVPGDTDGAGDARAVPLVRAGGPTAWLVSARSATALSGQAERLAEFVAAASPGGDAETPTRPDPTDVAWSLATGRAAFDHRAVIVGSGHDELAAGLDALATDRPSSALVAGVAEAGGERRVVFVFPGQGPQWLGMGRELVETSPVFAARLAECERALAPYLDWNLYDVLSGADGAPGLDRDDVVQPASFAVMISLAAVWQAAGVTPDAVLGHSQGEITAACVAGILSLEDAAKVTAVRSQLVQTLAGRGGMLSIAESLEAVTARLASYPGQATVGVVNSPDATVITGELGVLERIAADCERDGVRTRGVPINYASHSSHIDDIRDPFLAALSDITPGPGTATMVSAVTGETMDPTTAGAEYWYASLRRPVQFSTAVQTLDRTGYDVFVEVSPHPVLTGAISTTLEHARQQAEAELGTTDPGSGGALLRAAPVITGTLRRDDGGPDRILASLAEVHVRGVPVDWPAVLPNARRVELPTYAFEHRRFWLDAGSSPRGAAGSVPAEESPVAANGGGLRDRIAGRPAGEQVQVLLELVRAHAAAVLGADTPEAVQAGRTFKETGFDSLGGVELRTRLSTATGLRLPTTLIFDYPTPAALTGFLRAQLLGTAAVPTGPRPVRTVAEEPIAIVAMSCRLPGEVRDPEGLWELLVAGGDAIGDAPTDRGWDLDDLTDPDLGPGASGPLRRGGYLPDAADFDPAFFGISPREALAMDPQQRLLLETSWEALERAGVDVPRLRGSDTGVFIGAASSGYGDGGPRELEGHLRTGSATSVLSGRVAYTFGFEGPAVTVDTACSSSLVAVHLAAQALRSGECGLALAGGVTVHATPSWLTWFTRQHGLASDGRCKAFSADADGMGMAEGAGVVLLERLSDARRNGHRVLAVVAGTAVNQDGASNGLTAPNGPSQQRVIRAALANAGLSADDVDAVEAHGTGTMLGDPIEAQALLATYGQDRDTGRPLRLGTVKSNIGHTQWAAGAAGVIKMVLALQHAQLPRTLHADAPSPHVDWSSGTVQLLTEPEDWPDRGQPRRAGVSAFGISGTNAHVILEQAPDDAESDRVRSGQLPAVPWLLSARGHTGLAAQAGRLREYVLARPELDPIDVGWSLATSGTGLPERAVVVGADRDELLSRLAEVAASSPGEPVGVSGSVGKVGFVFTGQGAQRVGMGRQLYAAYPVFADVFDAVCAALDEHLDQPGLSVDAVIGGAGCVDDTVWAQAGLFAVEVALFRLLESWGVAPAALAGHSIGELAAAHVAGVWSLADACAVVAARGRLMQALPSGGAMLSVRAAEDDVRAVVAGCDGVGIAAVNGPDAVVISGPEASVASVEAEFSARGVRVRRLRVSHAFHSSLMEPMLAEFATVAASVSYARPRIPLVSTVTGRPATDELLDPGYWVRQVREPVRFADALTALRDSGVRTFVEIGPDAVLTALGAQTTPGESSEVWLPALRRDRDEAHTLVSAVGQLGTLGGGVDWSRFYAGAGARRVDLPTYAFSRQRYWLTSPAGGRPRDLGLTASGHPLLGTVVELPASDGLVLTGRLSLAAQPWLADHVVAGQVVAPGAALVEMAIRAGDETGSARLAEMIIQVPLVLPDRGGIQVRITLGEPDGRGERDLAIHSRPEHETGPWTGHATGVLAPADAPEPAAVETAAALRAWPPSGALVEDLAGLYPMLADAGLPYGPAFRGVRGAWRRGEEIFVEVGLGEGTDVAGFGLHPILLDAALHLIATPDGESGVGSGPLLPFAWADTVVHATGAATARVRIGPAAAGEGVSLLMADQSGGLIATVGSLVLRPLVAAAPADSIADEALFELHWVAAGTATQHGPAAPDHGGWAVLGSDHHFDATGYADVPALLAAIAAGVPAPEVVVFRAGAVTREAPTGGDAQASDLAALARDTTLGALAVVQAFLLADELSGARLLVLTERAVDAGAVDIDVCAAGVWGLVRVAQAEHPDRIVLLDLDSTGTPESQAGAIASGEPQLAVRGGQLLVPRLARVDHGLPIPSDEQPGQGWRLECTERGTLDHLVLEPTASRHRPLAEGEVRVELRAAGMNFRDVLNVLGMYPGDAGQLGLEGAGIVWETGPGVTGLHPGDRVMGLFTGAFGPVGVTDARLLAPVPAGWTLAQAAAAPVVYLTAWHALVELAGLRAGESVLIHAAAGGVGVAAVQLARYLGAEVFGTASPAKWALLREAGLDEAHLASSRTTDFEAHFPRGIDVVLDSLAGEFVDASLRLAAGPGGRFIEIGKTDIRDAGQVARDHQGLAYRAFDLLELEHERIAEMFAALSDLFARRVLRPLPVSCWDVRRAPEAFRYLSQARNVGKIVLTMPAPAVEAPGTTLVTGVSGALGGLVARHLATGAGGTRDVGGNLLLLSRGGPNAPRMGTLAADLAALGTGVHMVAADVADREQLASVLAAIPTSAPLRAVVHAAGVLDDGVIGSLTQARVEAVLRPKVDGAWNLHHLTRHLDLDRFVLFSSVSGLWGNPGQAGYAAANTFLDALAGYRRRAGLAATSLVWGPWQVDATPSGGMAAALGEADWRRMARQGLAPHTGAEGLGLLDAVATSGQAMLVAARLDLGSGAGRPALLSDLVRPVVGGRPRRVVGSGSPEGDGGFAQRLARLSRTDSDELVHELVRAQTALVLGMSGAEVAEPGRTFRELGIDSLTAVELRNRLSTVTGLRLPAGVVFDYPTPSLLAGFLATTLRGDAEESSGSATTTARAAGLADGDELVIVGIGCRFPGGIGSAGELWDVVSSGTDAMSGFPADRGRLWEGVFDQQAGSESHSRVGAFLYGAGHFDAQFFGISPREALAMDPQQRLLLETSWEALEDAGIDPGSLQGSSTGVFAGLIYHDYGAGAVMPEEVHGYLSTGGSGGVASGRVAYALGLEGPAVTVDTACSSSLVALHLAAQALRSGECTLALAGGVTVMATPGTFLEFARQRGLAADGRCKAYAQSADGTGWGEGVGVLVVERLSDARRNGHRVLAVVAGTAVNQDGASNGLTAPSGPSQQRVIRAALHNAGLRPDDVDVIEGHGTGTRLGDPIEAEALIATYGQHRDTANPVLLGSVKSNIGHTQAAAGVAGIIKMVQAMAHGIVPATLHVDQPSTHVDWDTGAVQLVTEPTPWPETDRPRRAAVSSFGFSGTNAHVILAQPPAVAPDSGGTPTGQLPAVAWLLSARDQTGLAAQADRLRTFLLARPQLDPTDIGWSLATTRATLPHRAAVVGADRNQLLTRLAELADTAADQLPPTVLTGQAGALGKLGFVFTGQGAQRAGMGRQLYAAYPEFADTFDAVCAGLDEHLDGSVRAVVHGTEHDLLDQTVWAQAGLFAVEVALFRLLESWGVTPAVVAGHSIGELAAAHVAGVWSLADACAVVAARGRLMQALPVGGAMLSAQAGEDQVRAVLAGHPGVSIAAVNAPDAVVVSGADAEVAAVREQLAGAGVRVRQLRVSHAFHSALMEPMLARFAETTASVTYQAPRIPLVSTLTGRLVDDEVLDSGYWVRQVCDPVRFADAVASLRGSGVRTVVEIGPDAVLTALGSRSAAGEVAEAWIPALRRERDEAETVVSAVGQLGARGAAVDWSRFYAGTNARRVDLPTYAFSRQRYWLDAATSTVDPTDLGQSSTDHPLLGTVVELPASGGVVLTGRLSVAAQPWLADHVVAGQVVVPGAALVEMAVRAGNETDSARLAELVIQVPLVLPDRGGIQVRITVGEPDEHGHRELSIHSRPEDESGPWSGHAIGVLAPEDATGAGDAGEALLAWPPPGALAEDLTDLYPALARTGLPYGPAFQGVHRAWRRGEEIFVEVGLAEGTDVAGFGLHPVLLDAALHLLAAPGRDSGPAPLLPFAWTDTAVHATGATTARVRLTPASSGDGVSLLMADESGGLIATVGSLVLRPLSSAPDQPATVADEALFELGWMAAPSSAGGSENAMTVEPTGWAVLAPSGWDDGDLDLPGLARYAAVAELSAAVAGGAPIPEVVVLPVPSGAHEADLGVGRPDTATAARELASATLRTVQDWLAADGLAEARLLVVTRNAVAAGPGAAPDPVSAPVQGLLRVATAENPGRFVLADIDDLAATPALLAAGVRLGEPEFALRRGELRLPRLTRPADTLVVPADADAWRLDFTERGTLDNLLLAPIDGTRQPLGRGQVRVALRAAGVNFRDVLNVLGMYPGDAGRLGLEGAGTVVDTGPDVTDLHPGDQVMGLFTGAFSPHTVTDARLLAPVPAGWTLAQAAAAPVVYLTAYYALVELAELENGESVLIHAAAGGVGIAAVQLARHLGAEVFGTASPAKWPVLRGLGLPGTHVASSRTLEFEDTFRAATGGAGIDVVLDSLAGEFVDASARLAAGPRGRFIEMGKTDVRHPDRIAAEHNGLAYRAFDLLDTDPDRIAEMFAALSALFAGGVLQPPPVACWDVRRAPEAFRYLSQARNVGKVVLTIPAPARRPGSVLITGASGALGALVARHLADRRGVRSLVLVSRRGPHAPGAARLVAELAGRGVRVEVSAGDVADQDHLAAILARADRPGSAPLRGVVHAAGLLDDGVIGSLSSERLDAVMRPKVDGAWHLHQLTRHLDLDLFVLFSSIAGIWGNPGQANYAAANTFLDALAGHRHSHGLPATSLAWGPWRINADGADGADGAGGAGGMAATLTEADWQRMARQGMAPLSGEDGLGLLDASAGLGRALLVPARLDLRAGPARPALLSGLVAPVAGGRARRAVGSAPAEGGGGFAQRLAALPEADRDQVVLDLLRTQTALVLGMAGPDALESLRSFRELGIDSLAAVELRNRLNAVTGLRLPAGVVFDYPTPSLLAGFLTTAVLGAASGPGSATSTVARAAVADGDELVIVGIGCRFPGGIGSPGEFWDLVSSGTDAVSPFPRDRGPLWDGVFDLEPATEAHTRAGAFLHDAGEFDAQFFGISPREALAMDPQQRLLLETSWEALEDAGIDPASLHGSSTGVFAGLIYHDYGAGAVLPEEVQGYLSTGGSGGVASGRVAYALGLEGPAVTVDTACSSSLVALHLAAAALRSGECSLALAGGVTVMATPSTFLEFARQRGLAADGRCKAYARSADGTGWGEGVGVLVVERLSDARRNGHRVLAVLAGTAVNQDGASNGLTAPNGPSQQRVIRTALASAGLTPADVDVIEGHGTGTRLGDPIEAEALIATYGQGRDADHPVLLGSVKSNLGHTQAAAGVAGVIKMVQAMAHGVVPATLHVDEPSAHVDWAAGAVRLVTEPTAWPETDHPRRAAVSSFGFSGTNAHVILEQPPVTPASRDGHDREPVLAWPISARNTDGLAAQAGRLREFVLDRPELDPVDVGWSLATVRANLAIRAVVLGADRDELLARLAQLAADPPGQLPAGVLTGGAESVGKVGFVFTGQGAQRIGMGQRLYAEHSVFAEAFDAACAGLEEHLDRSVRAVVHGPDADALDRTVWAQAGLFALEVALFRLLESWGVTPAVVAGHSIGELAAAHVAGVWSLADACAVVAARGRLMQALPAGGAMLSVRASEAETGEVLAAVGGVDIAAVNGPNTVVVSGPGAAVSAMEQEFSARGVRTRRLRVSHAFHSSLMEPMLAEFASVTGSVSYARPGIPIVSTLTGQLVGDEVLDPSYWVRQVRRPVRFADAVSALRDAGVRTFVEVGPDPVLTALGGSTKDDAVDEVWIPALRRAQEEPLTAASVVAQVHARGGTVDWSRYYAGTGARRVDLPTYAFARQRYWLDAATGSVDPAALGQTGAAHPLLGASMTVAGGGLLMTGRLSVRSQPWLGDHVVAGRVVVPGTALVEMAVRAGDETGQTRLAELVIETPLILPADGGIRIQVSLEAADEAGRAAVSIYSQPEQPAAPTGPEVWTRHATGVLATAEEYSPDGVDPGVDLAQWPPAGAVEQDLHGLYPALHRSGLSYGPAFRAVRKGWRRGAEIFAEVALDEGTPVAGFGIHPALLDACLHLLGLPVTNGANSGAGNGADDTGPLLPFAWTDVVVHATHADTVRVRLAPAEHGDGLSVTLADETGELVASARSIVLRPLPAVGLDDGAADQEAMFEVAWVPARLDADPGETPGTELAAGWAVLAPGAPDDHAPDLELAGVARYAGVAELVAAVAAGARIPEVVVLPCLPDAGGADPATTARTLATAVLGSIQDWLAAGTLAEARLLVVTRRAVDAGTGSAPDPASATVQGLMRVAIAENPGRFVLADIDDVTGIRPLLVAGVSLGEPEFAVRQREVRLPRLGRPGAALSVPEGAAAWRLDFTERGTLDNLVLTPADGEWQPVGPGQVRVGLRAAGVNFRDVLNVLGMYPGEAGQLGLEGAGIVLETGPGVTGLSPGDQVMGLFTAAFGPVAVTDARLLVPVPAGWTLTKAAAAPVVFLTAYYALVDLAGLDSGETILIHAAAGGVGIAAVQLAHYLGAEVFGTASPSKWSVLRELGLPETHVASSRTLDFEDSFRAVTGGAGVDVVLDSLAGSFVDASARLAAGPGGRFIEMGKTDVRDPSRIAADHDGLVYRAFDLLDTGPDRIAEMFAALSKLFARGVLRPPPVACWDVRRAPEAFRHLSQARNVGKVVLTIPARPDPTGTVLVTGASGALGALVARHLADRRGVRSLALLSRRGPHAPGAATLAADLADRGVAVRVLACDVADRDQLTAILAGLPESAPLRGVVHAAGLLDDGVIGALTPERVGAVLRPKVDGAWQLHELTRHLHLDLFVLFSSIAGIWGNPGQANYAAANTFL
ncbi:MAG TPA: SDR family NAD(P)-dependent oxidoreductase, partial [Pseudonocardia sp.]